MEDWMYMFEKIDKRGNRKFQKIDSLGKIPHPTPPHPLPFQPLYWTCTQSTPNNSFPLPDTLLQEIAPPKEQYGLFCGIQKKKLQNRSKTGKTSKAYKTCVFLIGFPRACHATRPSCQKHANFVTFPSLYFVWIVIFFTYRLGKFVLYSFQNCIWIRLLKYFL